MIPLLPLQVRAREELEQAERAGVCRLSLVKAVGNWLLIRVYLLVYTHFWTILHMHSMK